MVRVWSGEQIPAPHLNLNLTSILPLEFTSNSPLLALPYLDLTFAQPTTVWKPQFTDLWFLSILAFALSPYSGAGKKNNKQENT